MTFYIVTRRTSTILLILLAAYSASYKASAQSCSTCTTTVGIGFNSSTFVLGPCGTLNSCVTRNCTLRQSYTGTDGNTHCSTCFDAAFAYPVSPTNSLGCVFLQYQTPVCYCPNQLSPVLRSGQLCSPY